MDNVRDEMANESAWIETVGYTRLSACGKRKRIESASLSRCGFLSIHYLEVKTWCKHALGPRVVSAVWSLEVFTSQRLPVYYKCGIFSP